MTTYESIKAQGYEIKVRVASKTVNNTSVVLEFYNDPIECIQRYTVIRVNTSLRDFNNFKEACDYYDSIK